MSSPTSRRKGGSFFGVTACFYVVLVVLTFASFATTDLGAQWLMAGDKGLFRLTAGLALALGIQLLIPFASLVIDVMVESASAARIRWRQAAPVIFLAIVVAAIGILLSAGTSYVNYHQVVNEYHLQGQADIGIEDMERGFQSSREKIRRSFLTYIGLSVKQASAEWAFWDSERRLQDSLYSPNEKGRGSRFTFAHTRAEALADYIEFHTGTRPQGEDAFLSRQAGSMTTGRPTAQRIEEEFNNVPESLDLYDEVKGIAEPRRRFLAAYMKYRAGMQRLIKAFSSLPAPDTFRLPELQQEFVGKQVGDRVTLTVDGRDVSNVPVPPLRPEMPELTQVAPEVPPSYEVLRTSVTGFYQSLGMEGEAQNLAKREVLVIGEHPWLVAFSQATRPGIIEWITATPATLIDVSVLLLGLLHGLFRARREGDDPFELMDRMSRTLEAMIDGLGRRVSGQPSTGGA